MANINPKCPYVTLIQQCRIDIDSIKKALIGDDMQTGLVGSIKTIESKLQVQRSWADFVRPILIAVTASLATGAVIYVLTHL